MKQRQRHQLQTVADGGASILGKALLWGAVLLLAGCNRSSRHTAREALEEQWLRQGMCLVQIRFAVPEMAAARVLQFGRDTLNTHRLYLRTANGGADFLYIDRNGRVLRRGHAVSSLREQAELVLAEDRVTLYVDGRRVTEPGNTWEILWETAEETAPLVTSVLHPRAEIADSFMRHTLDAPPVERIEGQMALAQHGGGLPHNEQEEESFDFQRAANPFTVRGIGGALVYGRPEWAEYLAEARFYFGVPKSAQVVDRNTIPAGTDMLVCQGSEEGLRVAFGWIGAERRFCLASRRGNGPWHLLARHEGRRPPLTNWVRVGIAVRDGCRVEGWLDGVPVLQAITDERVVGPCRILVGSELTEFDDVQIHSLPLPPPDPQPVLCRSRAFAGKAHKKNADPPQFEQWARGQDTFVRFTGTGDTGQGVGIRARFPLVGPWEYRCQTDDEQAGRMPAGSYRFLLTRADLDRSPTEPGLVMASIDAVLDARGWRLDLPGWDWDEPLSPLRFRRTEQGTIEVRRGDAWAPIGRQAEGSVHLGIMRFPSSDGILVPPRPQHHHILCRNLCNEFFEEAPTDWSWIDGAFRMDARWACQDQWNFLACGDTGVPMMVSKRLFRGEQFHEHFVSQRPVMPWDAGDASFAYDPDEDRRNKHAILVANEGWYVRRDLNVSICCDGRNPLSGYALLIGADDNRETRLLRQGRIVARTSEPDLRFPDQPGFGAVHYFWRRVTLWQQGARLRVWINDRPAFDYTDPEPITSGHLAFWSVRNGFAIAKISSLADAVQWRPDALYVPPATVAANGWTPLGTDALRVVRAESDSATFERTSGTGFGAARFELRPPQGLYEAPVLRLPLELGEGVALNLHVHTNVGSFLVPISAPTTGMKTLLTPDYESGECFRLPTMAEQDVRALSLIGEADFRDGRLHCNLRRGIQRLRGESSGVQLLSLTLGNSSNTDYLLAAGTGNRAGSRFTVGRPTFLAEETTP